MITVEKGGAVGSVEISIDISHTYSGDLRIILEHDGVRVLVYNGSGGSSDDVRGRWIADTHFSDTDAAGEWILTVSDNATQDEGVLNNWGLVFHP